MTSCEGQKAAHCCGSIRATAYSIPAMMSFEFQEGRFCSKPDQDWITHPTVSRLVLSAEGVRSSASLFSTLSKQAHGQHRRWEAPEWKTQHVENKIIDNVMLHAEFQISKQQNEPSFLIEEHSSCAIRSLL